MVGLRGLREAILAASKFAMPHQSKDQSPVSGIRLLPRTEAAPARVYATRGTASILIDVEGDLPNLVVDAVGIEAATRADPDALIKIEQDLVVVGRYRFKPWCRVEQFPGLLTMPAPECFQKILDSRLIPRVLHAVSSDPSRPELHHLSFRAGFVEATDAVRLARVPVAINRSVQIHGDVFVQWRGGTVEWAVEAPLGAVFRWPGEVRWGQVYTADSRPYPDLSKIADERTDDFEAVVSVGSLKQAVKKATSVSPVKSVMCWFGPGAMAVSAVTDPRASKVADYRDTVPALCGGQGSLALNGSALVSALDALDTPRALLGVVTGGREPLKVRAGAYLEYIWPMLI